MGGGGGAGRRVGGSGGGAEDHHKTSIISSIMLRFRPIVPKPAVGEPLPGTLPAEGHGGAAARRRVKGKYRVRVRRKNIARDGDSGRSDNAVVVGGGIGSGAAETTGTLQLLPVRVEDEAGSDGHRQIGGKAVGAWSDRAVVESRVTVESVGGACLGAGTSMGGVGGLELDSCPAFVTDSRLSRVQWLNAAYVALATGGEGEAEVRVEMAAKEELPWWSAAFACQVRVEHTWRAVRYSKLVPCDVWRLDSGGFAWRLDVKAALSLGF